MNAHSTVAPESVALAKWFSAVSEAALPFESRWTERALRRVAPDLHEAWSDQRSMWQQASVTGGVEDIEEHGAATVRAYHAVVGALEAAAEPDDAFVLGSDPKTGLKVAIGPQKAAAERVREIHGDAVIWISPDEVAAILAGLEGFKQIAIVKQLFPGAEVVDIRPDEPAKAESGVGRTI